MTQKMIELDLKLKVPEKLIKKIKAYAVLVDQKPAEFVEYFTSDVLASKLNDMIDALIRGELGGEDTSFTTPEKLKEPNVRGGSNWTRSVESPIEADQGAELHDDEDLYQKALEEEADILQMTNVKGGVSDEEIEHDLDVDDPEHEAAGIAEEDIDITTADVYSTTDPDEREAIRENNEKVNLESFAETMGIDLGNIEPHIVGRRKANPDLGRGSVSAFGAGESERSAF